MEKYYSFRFEYGTVIESNNLRLYDAKELRVLIGDDYIDIDLIGDNDVVLGSIFQSFDEKLDECILYECDKHGQLLEENPIALITGLRLYHKEKKPLGGINFGEEIN